MVEAGRRHVDPRLGPAPWSEMGKTAAVDEDGRSGVRVVVSRDRACHGVADTPYRRLVAAAPIRRTANGEVDGAGRGPRRGARRGGGERLG